MLFVVFCKKGIYALDTGKQKLVKPLGFTSITCTDFTPSLITVLIPIGNLDKDICCLTDYLPVPSIFQLNRIGFVLVGHFRRTKAILA